MSAFWPVMWGCRKAVKSLPGGDSWRYGGWRDQQASAGSKGLVPCQCLEAHLERVYNHISFVGVHLHNTVQSFSEYHWNHTNVCGANQIFSQKLRLKDSVKVLHCPVTLILKTSHKYDYVHLTVGLTPRPLKRFRLWFQINTCIQPQGVSTETGTRFIMPLMHVYVPKPTHGQMGACDSRTGPPLVLFTFSAR